MRDRNDRHALIDGQAVTFETDKFPRIIGNRPDRLEAEIEKNLGADSVVAQVRLEAEPLIRFDGIDSLVLKLVGLELVEQADAAALLIEIDDDALSFFGNHFHRGVELPTTVAAQGMKHVARQALRVHPHENTRIGTDIPINEGDMLMRIDVVPVTDA